MLQLMHPLKLWPSMENKIEECVFSGVMNDVKLRSIFSLLERGGKFEGLAAIRWIESKLNVHGRNMGHLTFAEFYEKTRDQGVEVTFVVSDITARVPLYLNHRTAPNLPVSHAVRMSMSIPWIWQPAEWIKEYGLYMGEDITGHLLCDGGLISNFAIHLLLETTPKVVGIMGSMPAIPIIGFLLDEEMPLEKNAPVEKKRLLPADPRTRSLIPMATNVLETMRISHDEFFIRTHSDAVCRIPAKGYGTTEFDISGPRLEALVASGASAMAKFFDKKN